MKKNLKELILIEYHKQYFNSNQCR